MLPILDMVSSWSLANCVWVYDLLKFLSMKSYYIALLILVLKNALPDYCMKSYIYFLVFLIGIKLNRMVLFMPVLLISFFIILFPSTQPKLSF